MKTGFFGILIGLIAGVFALFKFKGSSQPQDSKPRYETVTFDNLTLTDLLPWYKEKLVGIDSSKDITPLLLKASNEITKNLIHDENSLVQVIYNSSLSTIVDARIIKFSSLDTTLIDAFDDKDMLVLK